MIDVICGDCRDVMQEMDTSSVDAIVTDPPYGRFKSDAWDRQWSTDAQYLDWLDGLCSEWFRLLKPNGSLYVFASPRMSARVEVKIGERFNVLNRVTWAKPPFATKAEMSDKDSCRLFFPVSESIIFAEHHGADNIAKGEAGYEAKCDELRGFVFEPLRAYLDDERKRAGVNFEQVRQGVGCADGSGLPSHWFTHSQWALPTAANYAKLQELFNAQSANGTEYLRREYEDLRREYEDLRRPFNVTADVPYTDVWTFDTVRAYPGKHPCEKPLDLMRHIIESSTRPDAVVYDPFMGSGSTGVACAQLGRSFIGSELSPDYTEQARQRIAKVQPSDITCRNPTANVVTPELEQLGLF